MSTPSDDYLDTAVQQALGSLSREDIESMMISGYAEEMGVDEDAVRDYIEQMDDDTLMEYVAEMARTSISEPVRGGRERTDVLAQPAAACHGPRHDGAQRLAV